MSQIITSFIFQDKATTIGTGNEYNNISGDVLQVEVSGNAGSFMITPEARCDYNSDSWTTIGAISMSDYSVDDNITANGIYLFPLVGLNKIRFAITTIGSGSINILGKVCL